MNNSKHKQACQVAEIMVLTQTTRRWCCCSDLIGISFGSCTQRPQSPLHHHSFHNHHFTITTSTITTSPSQLPLSPLHHHSFHYHHFTITYIRTVEHVVRTDSTQRPPVLSDHPQTIHQVNSTTVKHLCMKTTFPKLPYLDNPLVQLNHNRAPLYKDHLLLVLWVVFACRFHWAYIRKTDERVCYFAAVYFTKCTNLHHLA